MSKIAISTRTLISALMLTALGALFIPAVIVQAQTESEPGTPPPASWRERRLERIWARQQRTLERLTQGYDHLQQRLTNAQDRIDHAQADGTDVTAVQAALDAFSAAVADARPVLESAKGIVAAHRGFDGDGSVIDATQASETVQAMAAKFREIRHVLFDPGRALRAAVRDFRQAQGTP